MISNWKYQKTTLFFIVLSVVCYGVFAYQLNRTDFPKFIGLYLGLFILAYQLYRVFGHNLKTLLGIGLVFRLVFIIAIPNLSQDFYRFIWDGYLNNLGINPYLFQPNELMSSGISGIPNAQILYDNMGDLSASNYSNYPPLNQLCFILANLMPGQSVLSSVIGLRLIIILADVGILLIGGKLLKGLNLPISNLFWYFLNPFIIIELTGNLHFEGVMLFFLVLSLYLLTKQRLFLSAICFALSISVKLVPLMLLPLLFSFFTGGIGLKNSGWKRLKNYKKLLLFYSTTILVLTLSFLPFFSPEFLNNYSDTIGLWFNNFEFNASVYYIARAVGFAVTGYNEIAVIGKILPVIIVAFIFYNSVFKDNSSLLKLSRTMLLVVTIYLLFSTTVHPWYITTLVVLGLFTNFKYPVVWSLMVVLSYYAYGQLDFSEHFGLIALEYVAVIGFTLSELLSQCNRSS